MDITRFAINNSRTTFVALASIIFAGLGAYGSLPRAEDPGFVIRQAQIITRFPGASPERVEMLVTEPLERAIKQMPELDNVTSTSKTGLSIVVVSIKESYKTMRPIWDSLRRKIQAARADLPDGAFPPEVNDEFGDVFGIILTVTGEGFTYAELEEVGKDIRDDLLRLEQAGKVEIHGTQDEQIFVEYDNARLSALGISPFQLQQILESRNVVMPGGSVNTGEERIMLEPTGNYESLDDLGKTVIPLPGRGVIYLRDVARVTRAYVDPPSTRVYSTGAPALAIAVSLRDGGNITVLGDQVKVLMNELLERYPIGVELDLIAYQPAQVNKKVDDFVESLLQSIAIVLAVMLLTLGLRTGLVVAALIPTTMLAALVLMQGFDIGLDQISLASLIIALGMLVDNAIVMSESIMVRMESGEPPADAAAGAAAELRVPLLVASLTTSASFLPIFLAKSTVGEYTASIFKVVTISLLSSWILALTMTPLMCVLFLKVKKSVEDDKRFDTGFYRVYTSMLTLGLKNRVLTLVATVGIFFGVMSLFGKVPFMFFPPADRPLLRAELRMPIGTPIERTDTIVAELSEHLEELKSQEGSGVLNWAAFVGAGSPRYNLGYAPEPPSPDYGYVLINLEDYESTIALQPKLEEWLLMRYPDLTPTVDMLKYGPPVKYPISVRISGKDIGPLFEVVRSVKAKLHDIPGTKNIKDNWGPQNKKLLVDVNQPRARRAGTSSQEIAISLQTVLSGITTTQYREGDKLIPVTLRSVSADRQDLGKIESLSVYSQATGSSVPLKQVADIEVAWQPAKILRRNQLKTVTISSELLAGYSSRDVRQVLEPWLAEQKAKGWPLGYTFEVGGETEESQKANQSIVDQLPIAGFLIILLLVGQFNSVRRAAIVSLTIPLGLIGVTLGLLMTGSYFGFMTFLGIISLAGIVINNAIVLLDRINLEIADGYTPQEAVLRASQLRLRPILLTTATTIGGLLPLWFGGGAMFEPMAIAIIFGMLFSTVLTLGVVPVLYSVFFRVRYS